MKPEHEPKTTTIPKSVQDLRDNCLDSNDSVNLKSLIDCCCNIDDKIYRWIIVVGVFIVQFWVAGLIKSYGVLFVEIMEAFPGCTVSQLSLIPAFLATLSLLLAPIASMLTEKYSCRKIVFIGGIICSTGMVLSSFSQNLFHLYLTGGLLTGIGAGLSTTPGIITIAKYFNTRRALANGLCVSGTAFGSIVFPYLIERLCDLYSFRGTVLIIGVCMLNISFSAILYKSLNTGSKKYPEKNQNQNQLEIDITLDVDVDADIKKNANEFNKPERKISTRSALSCMMNSTDDMTTVSNYYLSNDDNQIQETKHEANVITTNNKNNTFFDFTLFHDWNFNKMVMSVLLMAVGNPYMLYFLPAHMLSLGYTKSQVGFLLSVGAIFDLCGRLIFGWICDLEFINRKYFYASSIFFSGLSIIFMPATNSYIVLGILTIIFNICLGIWFLLVPVTLADFCGVERINSSYGLLRMCQSITVFSTLPVNGFIKDYTGDYSTCFIFMGVCVILGCVPVLAISAPRNVKKENSNA